MTDLHDVTLPLRLKVDGQWESVAMEVCTFDFGLGKIVIGERVANTSWRSLQAPLTRELLMVDEAWWKQLTDLEWEAVK